jgi:hypothetical protein
MEDKMSSSKYDPLEKHLKKLNRQSISMSFDEIQDVVGCKLPPSAFKHRPWWSNNPSNSVITYAWLKAGYKTADVDMANRRLVFRKTNELIEKQGRVAGKATGFHDNQSVFEVSEERAGKKVTVRFEDIYGCMKGTVTIMPGVDLTESMSEEWSANEQKWDEKLKSL